MFLNNLIREHVSKTFGSVFSKGFANFDIYLPLSVNIVFEMKNKKNPKVLQDLKKLLQRH